MVYVSRHNTRKLSGPWQILKRGKYNLRWTTTHNKLSLFT